MEDQTKLLGPLLVEEHLLAPEQLEHALQFAEDTGLPLDQSVVAEFAVSQPEISRLLAEVSPGADGAGHPTSTRSSQTSQRSARSASTSGAR